MFKEKVVNSMKKFVKLLLCTIFVLTVALVVLTACNGDAKKEPVYKGMTVVRNIGEATALEVNTLGDGFTVEADDEITQNMKDLISIDVETDDEVKYYVSPGETYIVQVHISNPDSFEIQSFTLNGIKYASYMFMQGSTMELLLLEVTAPTTSGYMELTIDAIKYIDGTEIKDVRIDGNKTIKTGVAYENDPLVTVDNEVIGTTSLSLNVNMIDNDRIVIMTSARIYITDGETHEYKQLVRGENAITFDNLIMGKSYKYGIVATYDKADGKGNIANWLVERSFATLKPVAISNLDINKESVDFTIVKTDNTGEISEIRLLETDGTVVQSLSDLNLRRFENLLSNHNYKIEIKFSYSSENRIETDYTVIRFKTLEKIAPTFNVKFSDIAETSAIGNGTLIDVDGVCNIKNIALYKGEDKISEFASLETQCFVGLNTYTEYVLKISYCYDLNDGVGEKNDVAEFAFTTNPHFEFTSCEIINTSVVFKGDTIYMQAYIDNPSNATYSAVKINGREYQASKSSTSTYLYVEILYEDQFAGGDTVLEIEQIDVMLRGKRYSIFPTKNNKDNIFINGDLKVEKVELVNSEYKIVSEGYVGEQFYIKITLDNSTNYEVYSVSYRDYLENGDVDYIELGADDIITADNNSVIYVPYNLHGLLENYVDSAINSSTVYSIKYRNSYVDKTIKEFPKSNKVWGYRNETVMISTAEDLLKMNGNAHYVLANDIDLKDYEWHGNGFSGVFDGNGHTISNMRVVGTFDRGQNLGLFSFASGIIRNLNMDKITIFVTANSSTTYYGAIAASGSNITIENCTVTNSAVSIQGNAFAGGIFGASGENPMGGGYYEYGNIFNCTNNSNITISSGAAGGIVGALGDERSMYAAGMISNCTNAGNISATKGYAGGIAGVNYNGKITDCVNTGIISSALEAIMY